jgi:hypothetical protein
MTPSGNPRYAGPAALDVQSGLTLFELVMSAFLTILLVVCGGYLFTTQIRGYKDMRNQAGTQSDLKLAMQGMTRQISNSGAFLANPRFNFAPEASRLTLAYTDLNGKLCADKSTVTMSFYSRHGSKEDSLFHDIRCSDGTRLVRVLARAPAGGLTLAFTYFDGKGLPTVNAGLVKAVQLDLSLQNRKLVGVPSRVQRQSIRVQCVNL